MADWGIGMLALRGRLWSGADGGSVGGMVACCTRARGGDGVGNFTNGVQVWCDEYLRVGASGDRGGAVGEKVHDGVSDIGVGRAEGYC